MTAIQGLETVALACQLLTRFESQDRLRVRLLVPRVALDIVFMYNSLASPCRLGDISG
jgi:hypothetical protein